MSKKVVDNKGALCYYKSLACLNRTAGDVPCKLNNVRDEIGRGLESFLASAGLGLLAPVETLEKLLSKNEISNREA